MWLHGYADNRQNTTLWHVLIINAPGKSCVAGLFRGQHIFTLTSCKSPVQRKLLWNTVIWKNEHNRQWLYGCMAVWLYGCMAVWLCGGMAAWLCGCMTVWLSGYQYLEGGCLKAKAVYDCRIITLHFSMLQQLGSWILHFVKNVKWRHLTYYYLKRIHLS